MGTRIANRPPDIVRIGEDTTRERHYVVTGVPRFSSLGYRWIVLAFVACLTVVACGEDEDKNTENPSTVVNRVFDASPAAGTPGRGGLPTDADTATVAIKDGRLDPDNIEGNVGMAFILIVNGDGQPHTLEIEGLVDSENVNAQGQTQIDFTIPEEGAGTKTIRLDGKEAGTFEAMTAGGSTDP